MRHDAIQPPWTYQGQGRETRTLSKTVNLSIRPVPALSRAICAILNIKQQLCQEGEDACTLLRPPRDRDSQSSARVDLELFVNNQQSLKRMHVDRGVLDHGSLVTTKL